jgi:hypothetical protein
VPHRQHELGVPEQDAGSAAPPALEAKTESFFASRLDPHLGQAVPFQFLERTSTSESAPHFPQ